MTRGMLVTVLGRLGNVPSERYKGSAFQDVSPDSYYAPYIDWAQQTGIVKGTGDNRFAPDEAITREQLAVMLANYVAFSQLGLKNPIDKKPFVDDEKISDYARDAIESMHQAGIINGRDDQRIDPQSTASRAEVATMLARLIRNVMQQ
ncbi:MAG TPA: S-layer homology domain-containing protein [Syntrophomonas sp.]|nr:S-layer homology domain-containing protein [Syntrophomonas sp.]